MSTKMIRIAELPMELNHQDAVATVYREDLDWIEDKLRQGLSVLVECDKQMTNFVYVAMRNRLRARETDKLRCRLISGHSNPDQGDSPMNAMQSRMQRILTELQDAIFGGEANQVIVLPHLDVLTTTTKSGLNMETREAAALLHENPDAVFLGFKDPSFELPKVIEAVFAVQRPLIGIPRDKLKDLILQREARKLGVREINPYTIYKYVSGLNAVRCRQILSHFQSRLDFDPEVPESATEIYREIRQMTLIADFDLPNVNLDTEIGGYDGVKAEIKTEILELLQSKESSTDPAMIQRIEEIIPKGIIFHGPPGTGKTFFAKAMATALDATIIIVSGPELKSKWVGESEQNLREVFAKARKAAPSIIVFDELDSFASARGTYTGSGVEHSMVNQMLTEMDGFRKEELVFVVGTTNFMSSLDPALLRPGRFELSIHIPYPNADDRKAIIDIYREKFGLNIQPEIVDHVVQKTAGFSDSEQKARYSGDHLYAVMRALKREELRRGASQMEVTKADVDKILGARKGGKKETVAMKEKEHHTIAVHEAGHAILAYVLPDCPTVEKIVVGNGDDDGALGYMMHSVKENKYITTRNELLANISVLMGGRLAEQEILGDISTGSYDDLQRASEIARTMVEELGMGGVLGLRTYGATQGEISELGTARRPISERMAQQIDDAITEMLAEQERVAISILQEYRKELDALVQHLQANKVCNLDELINIFGGRTFKGEVSPV